MHNLANALVAQARIDEAGRALSHLIVLRDGIGPRLRRAAQFQVIADSWEETRRDRARLADFVAMPPSHPALADAHREIGMTPFRLAYHGENDKALQGAIARYLLAAAPDLAWVAPHCRGRARIGGGPGGRIRVAFVSMNFGAHTIGKLFSGFLQHLPRDRLGVIAITSRRPGDDEFARQMAFADHWVPLPSELVAARQAIAEVAADIVFYTDIGMDPLTYFLAFARLAPVQATTFGHPDTTGIPNLDYFLTSSEVEPADWRDHYTERAILARHLPTRYGRPLAPRLKSRDELGLPAGARLYGCPQSLFKLDPGFDAVLADILRRDQSGRLVLISSGQPYQDQRLMSRFRRAFPDVLDRVMLIPRLGGGDYLALCAAMDVLLDPPIFGGGNTSLEAFAVGAPIVAFDAAFMRGRLTLGLHRRMETTDLVAATPEAYADLALAVAADPEPHRRRIRARAPDLYECDRTVEDLGEFFERAAEAAGREQRLEPGTLF